MSPYEPDPHGRRLVADFESAPAIQTPGPASWMDFLLLRVFNAARC